MPQPSEQLQQLYLHHRLALNGLASLLRHQRHDKIVIAGAPRSGKTTLASKLELQGYKVHDGEELVGTEWSEGSLRASAWLDAPGPWICENVAMGRAIRKWLLRNPTGVPADLIIHLDTPVVERTAGQATMAKGCVTVWREIAPELRRRGAKILEANS